MFICAYGAFKGSMAVGGGGNGLDGGVSYRDGILSREDH